MEELNFGSKLKGYLELSEEERQKLHQGVEREKLAQIKCFTCRDTRWVYKPVSREHPDFGKAYLCPACSLGGWLASKGEQAANLRKGKSGIGDCDYSFTNWEPVKGGERAFAYAKALAEGVAPQGDKPFVMLLILGKYGNGKTHLAVSAVRASLDRGVEARYYNIHSLAQEMHKNLRIVNYDSFYAELKVVPFLVIDDFGKSVGGDADGWLAGEIESLVDDRYQNYLPLLIASNRDLKELPPAIVSRFGDKERARVIINTAENYRPKK